MTDRTLSNDFAWFARAGLDALLDALAARDAAQAERIRFGLHQRATHVEAEELQNGGTL